MYKYEIREAIAAALSGETVLIACHSMRHADDAFREIKDELLTCNVIHKTNLKHRRIRIDDGQILFRIMNDSLRGLRANRVIFDDVPTDRERELIAPIVLACQSSKR